MSRRPAVSGHAPLRRARSWLGVAAALFVAGCGQTGPLSLPEQAPAQTDRDGDAGAAAQPEAEDAESAQDGR